MNIYSEHDGNKKLKTSKGDACVSSPLRDRQGSRGLRPTPHSFQPSSESAIFCRRRLLKVTVSDVMLVASWQLDYDDKSACCCCCCRSAAIARSYAGTIKTVCHVTVSVVRRFVDKLLNDLTGHGTHCPLKLSASPGYTLTERDGDQGRGRMVGGLLKLLLAA